MAKVSEVYVGAVFGRLTVAAIGISYRNIGRSVIAYCACGSSIKARINHLGSNTNSCGCTKAATLAKAATKHGGSYTAEYQVWAQMWDRCTNPKHKNFSSYNPRKPPETWRDFKVFLSDLGPRPSSKHSLDRWDNTKGYSAENCRWATTLEQSRNRPNVRLYSFLGGEAVSLAIVAVTKGCSLAILRRRLYAQGKTVEESLGPGWVLVQGLNFSKETL